MSRPLSVTFFPDEPCQQPHYQPSTVNTELVDFIGEKALLSGYDSVKDLAKAFGTKNHDKIIRNLQEFSRTGNMNINYMNQLCTLLAIDKTEIDGIRKRHRDRLYAEADLFMQNFDLLLRNEKVILEDEQYRNIVFHGLHIRSAWVGRYRPLTLGELFYHYRHGDWVTPDCCGSVYVISAGGSVLSGNNRYQGYCSRCKKVFHGSRPSFGEIMNPFLNNKPDFEYKPTDCTVKQLVTDLLSLEAK